MIMTVSHPKRNRVLYAVLTLCVIALGLASRKFPAFFPDLVQPFIGDVLWALMVLLIFGFLFARMSSTSLALLALTFAFSIEISQLYHAPWIDDLRHTTLGGLVLGFGFLWSDLVCYSVGIALGFLGEKVLLRGVLVK